jgi:hypothetical protein
MLNLVCNFSQKYWSSMLTSFGTIFKKHLPQWRAAVLENLKAETHSATQDITYPVYNMSHHFIIILSSYIHLGLSFRSPPKIMYTILMSPVCATCLTLLDLMTLITLVRSTNNYGTMMLLTMLSCPTSCQFPFYTNILLRIPFSDILYFKPKIGLLFIFCWKQQ